MRRCKNGESISLSAIEVLNGTFGNGRQFLDLDNNQAWIGAWQAHGTVVPFDDNHLSHMRIEMKPAVKATP